MKSLTKTTAGAALAVLIVAGCGETGESVATPDTDINPVASAAATEKGQNPMFGNKQTGLLSVGDRAPDFEVADHDGNMVRLSDLAGKRVLIWFYPKADTPG